MRRLDLFVIYFSTDRGIGAYVARKLGIGVIYFLVLVSRRAQWSAGFIAIVQ